MFQNSAEKEQGSSTVAEKGRQPAELRPQPTLRQQQRKTAKTEKNSRKTQEKPVFWALSGDRNQKIGDKN